ncbi:Phage Tail Collar Domain [Vreelandella subterranea]|uniref:Phage Tail Collar Domain n=1 Tax=Vreelandella subterranea TaxID=416874 RepID=A0A1H9S213_9GAMM|nr:phage tail protein [Halomonas subterranea]SER79060.1 Phage Tail Collar Domain [Halomonas subterranea]
MVDRVYERNASDLAPQPPTNPSSGYPTAGNPAQGIPATLPGPYWYHMITESLRRVVVEAGLTPDHEDLDQVVEALQAMGMGTAQFQNYSSLRTYSTGETCRGSDGHFYEFYDRDGDGTVQDVDPTDSANRPHIWMRWDGVRPATVIEWRSETIPEGYVKIIGDDISRNDYRRIFDAWGTTYGEGDGETTFGTFDDRGEFKRGWDDGRGVDSGRVLADHQLDQMQQITGSVGDLVTRGAGLTTEQGAFSGQYIEDSGAAQGNDRSYEKIYFDSANSPDARTGDSTYPRNNAVIWLTKI